jgi:hypothetical protein
MDHLSTYTGQRIDTPVTVFIDNKALIKRMRRHQHHKWANPHSCLLSDWDITNEIDVAQKKRHRRLNLQWIRAHQDDDTPYPLLSLPAQLNVDADKLAGEYHRQAEPRPIVLRPSNTSLSLSIDGHSVTSKAKAQVRYAYASNDTFLHMRHLYNWAAGTEQEVDWDAHSTLRNAFQAKRATFTKHVFKILPTGKIAHRNDPSLAERCLCCSAEVEDNDHIMICPATDRRQWRNTLHRKLTARLSNPTVNSDPVLVDILWDGLSRFLFDRPEPLEVTAYPTEYAQLINSQQKIGWCNTIRGHFSIEWALSQNRYLQRTNKASDSCRSRNWTDSAGRLLVDQWFELWSIRNLARHGADKASQVASQKAIMETATTHLYDLQSKVLPRDRHLFSSSVAEHLRRKPNLTAQYNWVTLNSSLIKASVKAAALLNVNNVTAITSWLRRVPARLDG